MNSFILNLFRYTRQKSPSISALLVCTAVLILSPAVADTRADFENASKAACKNFRSCAMAEMAGQEGVTPQMKQMLEGLMAGVCDNMMNIGEVEQYSDLLEPATACMNSMATLSCEKLGGDYQTDECITVQKLAEKYH